MAEYIDRAKTKAYLYDNMMWYDEDGYIADDSEKDKALWDLVNGVPTADVIERSEYEALKSDNHELAVKYDNAVNVAINEQENVTKLRSKIDKAIEEIREQSILDVCRDAQIVYFDDVLEILRRNTGNS